jgi:hypothetical protein
LGVGFMGSMVVISYSDDGFGGAAGEVAFGSGAVGGAAEFGLWLGFRIVVVAATLLCCSPVGAAPVGIGEVLSAASSALVSLRWTYSFFFSMEPRL